VNFWASWCVPCRDEAPTLERVWERYKDRGVVFIGVDYVDSETEALKYLKAFRISYPNGPDVGTEISHRYRIQGIPETYFVGKDGYPVENHIGPIDEPTLSAKIEELLGR
jgi:cytochrome c biogenesis protein CcmG, thiol:disulfide interchange protein DsbE